MSGWSAEPSDITDQQCEHCHLYFTAQGIHNHEASCPLEGEDVVFTSPGDSADRAPGTESADILDSADGEVQGTQDSAPETAESVVATDGGTPGLGLDGPPTPQQAVEDAVDDAEASETGCDPNALECPLCGADAGLSADDLEPGKTYRCTECDKRLEWSP
jgi:hypothetical protein